MKQHSQKKRTLSLSGWLERAGSNILDKIKIKIKIKTNKLSLRVA
jgi:hypothetical protein